MAAQHGRHTVIKVGTDDVSQYCNTSELNQKADVHDRSGYGARAHRKNGGLLDGTFTMGGTYDNTAVTGPRAVLKPLIGETVSITRQTEGTGAGKPQDVFDAVMTSYVETNPVADNVSWSAEFEIDGEVDDTPQAA